jgi:hypothetical protein
MLEVPTSQRSSIENVMQDGIVGRRSLPNRSHSICAVPILALRRLTVTALPALFLPSITGQP